MIMASEARARGAPGSFWAARRVPSAITCSRTCAWTRGSLTPLPPPSAEELAAGCAWQLELGKS